MSEDLDFDFTEEELYQAFRLALPDDDAAAQARILAASLDAGQDWATSEESLLLLALGSTSGAAKVRRIRQAEQEGRKSTWRSQRSAALDAGALEREWAAQVDAEDEDWQDRLRSLRLLLREQGKLPPEA